MSLSNNEPLVSESKNESFIVKIWIEEINKITGKTVWRGSIQEVSSGILRHVKRLDEITMYFQKYLISLGVKENEIQ